MLSNISSSFFFVLSSNTHNKDNTIGTSTHKLTEPHKKEKIEFLLHKFRLYFSILGLTFAIRRE